MLTMSAIFRSVAAVTKSISQALAIAGVMVLWIVIYTGFTLQRSYMHPWFKWTSWINPVCKSNASPYWVRSGILTKNCSLCFRSSPCQRSPWPRIPLCCIELSTTLWTRRPLPMCCQRRHRGSETRLWRCLGASLIWVFLLSHLAQSRLSLRIHDFLLHALLDCY